MNQQNQEILQAVYDQQWASTRQVERSTRFSYNSVVVKLRELVDGGFVDKREGSGRNGANEYRVNISALPAVITETLT